MAQQPVFAATPIVAIASLAAVAACTTRAPTATAGLAAANIIALTAVSTSGLRIDSIEVTGAANAIGGATTAGLVGIWAWDGTTAYLIDEISVNATTPSATTPTFQAIKYYTNPIALPAAYRLYCSTSVTTTAAANALSVAASGGAY